MPALWRGEDFDLFLPPDADNLLRFWTACADEQFDLWMHDEPLARPRDRWLAERIVERRAATRVTGPNDLTADLTLTMAGFDFEAVWNERREFVVDDAIVSVARLLHIITSKHTAGRDKDRLFLATHRDALEQLLKKGLDDPTEILRRARVLVHERAKRTRSARVTQKLDGHARGFRVP